MKQLVFLPTSLCAADTTESEADLKELFQTCELSLTVRSKLMQLPTLLRKWKRDKWMKLLFSRTSRHFRIENLVVGLPCSVQDSLVNHLAVQGNDKQQKTQDTCTRGSQMELQLCDHDMSSSKMLKESSQLKQGTENRYLNMSSETWKKEVTAVRGEYSQRLKSVHRTKENECSSLQSYLTPTSRDWKGKQANEYKDERGEENNIKFASLPGVVEKLAKQNWATPNTMDHLPPRTEEGLIKQATGARKGRITPANLREQVDEKSCEVYTKLNIQQDQGKSSMSGKNQEQWLTPKSRDYRDVENHILRNGENIRKTGQKFSVGLPTQAHLKEYPNAKEAKAKLNVNWVEQLMGLPTGWTDLGSWATE